MPHSGSKPHRLRSAIIVTAFAAVVGAITWTLIRSRGAEDLSPVSPAAITARAPESPEGHQVSGHDSTGVSKPTRKLKSTVTGASLPPPGIPLAQTYAELKARADAGDAAAASRLFRDTYRCVMAQERLRGTPSIAARLLESDTSKMSAEQLARREKYLANLEDVLSKAQRDSQLCEGLDENQLLLTPLMLEAAKLGDVSASNCYVSGYMLSDSGLFDHPEWLSEYKHNVLAIAQSAVAQGDWGAVAQLQHAYARDGHTTLGLQQIVGPDPTQNYRYLKLRRLGANTENAPYYDKELSYAANGMPADQIAAGDTWAQDTYLRYFSAAPENTVGAYNSPTCSDPSD